MSSNPEIATVLYEMLADLLPAFDEKVPQKGPFNDLRLKRQVYFNDPATTLPGMLEIAVMHMDQQLDPQFSTMRFVAVRVKKSNRGGTVSATCFHGTTDEVQAELEKERRDPKRLIQRIQELASGLPEETNPKLWR